MLRSGFHSRILAGSCAAVAFLVAPAVGDGSLCPYVATVVPPTECGLVDRAVVPRGVNGLGHWVGYTTGCDTTAERPLLWTPETGKLILPVPPGTLRSIAYGINDRGTVVGIREGTTNGQFHNDWACVWMDGQFIELPGDAGSHSNALAVNNSDWVVGWRTSIQPGATWMGFVWRNGELTEIDPRPFGRALAQCTAVADSGWIAGLLGSVSLSNGVAFRAKDSEIQLLPPLPGAINSVALGVTDEGITVGYCRFEIQVSPGFNLLPTVWGVDGAPSILPVPPGFEGGRCISVSEQGMVLGAVWKFSQFGFSQTSYVVWIGGQPHFLNSSIQPVSGAAFSTPSAMSNAGHIVGTGSFPGTTGGGWLLVPHVSPADLNDDCVVDGQDIAGLLAQWGASTDSTTCDFDLDGRVDGADLGLLLAEWTATR